MKRGKKLENWSLERRYRTVMGKGSEGGKIQLEKVKNLIFFNILSVFTFLFFVTNQASS